MRGRSRFGIALTLVCGMLLPGCASKPTQTPADQAAALQAVVDRGYEPARKYSTTSFNEIWAYGEMTLDITLVEPAPGGSYPLVIYLPGLGESAQAGVLWRNAWAKAGYVVLSVQPATEGESVLRSKLALAGEFEELAREHFSPSSLKTRLEFVAYVLAEAKRLAASGVVRYTSIDLSRVAVAGYDLGAQTASAIAGEAFGGSNVRRAVQKVGAVIILSPYAGPSTARAQRPLGISMPVLVVTGTDDGDPFGIVSAEARLATWELLPAGDKYLLLLAGGTHAVLAGLGMVPTGGEGAAALAPGPGDTSQTTNRRTKRGPGAATGDPTPQLRLAEDDNDRSPDSRSEEDIKRSDRQSAGRRVRPFDVHHIADVQSVTTAFLDSTLKKELSARNWLTHDAARWIGDSGEFRTK